MVKIERTEKVIKSLCCSLIWAPITARRSVRWAPDRQTLHKLFNRLFSWDVTNCRKMQIFCLVYECSNPSNVLTPFLLPALNFKFAKLLHIFKPVETS